MTRNYLNLTAKLLFAFFLLQGIAIQVSAVEKTVKFTDAENRPVSNYTFTFIPGEIRATTNANGTCTVDFPQKGIYEIIPEYWTRTLTIIEIDDNTAPEIPVYCPGGIFTFALKGLDRQQYEMVTPITCNGQTIQPQWNTEGKWHYLSDNHCIDYMLNISFGIQQGSTCDFTDEIELIFDLAGKQPVTVTVTDQQGAPLSQAYVNLISDDDSGISTVTDEQGSAMFYLQPGNYNVTVNKNADETAVYYSYLEEKITVANAPVTLNMTYQGNSATLNVSAVGYQHTPLQYAYLDFRDKQHETSFHVTTNPEGKAQLIVTRATTLSYTASCEKYVKELSGKIDIPALSGTYTLSADFSDCVKTTLLITNIPETDYLSTNLVVRSTNRKILNVAPFYYNRENPDNDNVYFYIAPGSYSITAEDTRMENYTDSHTESSMIYPIEKSIQISREQQITFSFGNLHNIDFTLDTDRFRIYGLEFFKDGQSCFSTGDTKLYMPDGEFEWRPALGFPNEGIDYTGPVITGEPRKFTVNGSDLSVVWNIGAYHKAAFSFGGTADGHTSGYMDLTLTRNGKYIYNTDRGLNAGEFISVYLPDGVYEYEVEIEDIGDNNQESEEYEYDLPVQTGTIDLNGNDIQKIISYRDYIPLEVRVTSGGTQLPNFYFEVKNTAGKTLILNDISGKYKIYLLPGEYQFIATAPLYTTARETKTVTSDTRQIELNVNTGGGYAAIFYFYETENYEEIEGVKVELGDYPVQLTQREGLCFFFDLPAETYLTLKATKEGYRPLEESLLVTFTEDDWMDDESVIYKGFEMERIYNSLEENTLAPENIVLYPNPATDFFSLRLPETETGQWTLILTDTNGKLVMNTVIRNGNPGQVDISSLPKGMYMVKAYNRSETRQGKLLKK